MPDAYSFGIEVEISAIPRKAGSAHTYYYEQFAQALRQLGQDAKADDRVGSYRKHIEEYQTRWWITSDGSISSSGSSSVELEAVSPIFHTSKDWESRIDAFWHAQNTVFHMPAKNKSCGSHVHVAPGTRQRWSLEQLRNIAVGITCYEKQVREMLPVERRDNEYCRENTSSSGRLISYYSASEGWNPLKSAVRGLSRASLISLMQNGRRVLWNFEPAAESGIGTIEFRGGRHLRGHVRTKRWIAFAVAYIHFLLEENICTRGSIPASRSTSSIYADIRRHARQLDLARYLPQDYRVLNEMKRTAAESSFSFSSSIPLPSYPVEPPPAYVPPVDDYRAYSPERLERQPATASQNRTSLSEGGRKTQVLRRGIYLVLRALQFIFSAATLGVYVHAGNEGAIDSAAPDAVFAKLVSGMSLVLAVSFVVYGLVMSERDLDPSEGKHLGRRVWWYEWLVDLFLVYVFPSFPISFPVTKTEIIDS